MARKKADGFEERTAPQSAFLGALRSELDDSAELHEGFQDLEEAVATTRAAYLGFKLSPEEAGRLFSQLVLASTDNREWTVGSTSGDWYCRETGRNEWVPVEAPVGIEPDERRPCEWRQVGIGLLLKAYQETSQSQEAGYMPGTSLSGMARPAGTEQIGAMPAQEAFKVASAAPLVPARSLGEDSAWLLDEWNQQAPQVAPLRVVESEASGLPEDLPKSWDESRAFEESLSPEQPAAPAPRDDTGFTSPEDFFLPPDAG